MTGVDKGRILIVEGDPHVQRLLFDVMRFAGHDPEAVATGADALLRAEALRPEVVLFDLMLEDMTGIDCHRALVARGHDHAAVLVAARLTRETAVEATNAGFERIVGKPLPDRSELARLVTRALEAARLRRSNRALAAELGARNAALEASNAQLRELLRERDEARASSEALLQTVPFPIVLLTEGRRVAACNLSFTGAFGAPSLPPEFLSDAELAALGLALESEAQVYLFNRGWQSPQGKCVFEVTARNAPLADGRSGLLLCMHDRTASLEMQRRFDRRRRLYTLGSVAAGLADDLLDPVTFLKVNLAQLRSDVDLVHRAWSGARIKGDLTQVDADLADAAEDALDGAGGLLDECEQGLRRVHNVIRALPELASEDPRLESLDLREILERALLLTRGQLRPRCETRVAFRPMRPITARAGELVQAFIDLLLTAASWLQSWGVLHVTGAEQGEAACITLRTDEERGAEPPAGPAPDIDLSDSMDLLQRQGGSLHVEYTEGGGLALTVRLPVDASVRRD